MVSQQAGPAHLNERASKITPERINDRAVEALKTRRSVFNLISIQRLQLQLNGAAPNLYSDTDSDEGRQSGRHRQRETKSK